MTLNEFNQMVGNQTAAKRQTLQQGGWDALFAGAKKLDGIDTNAALYSGNQFWNPFGTATPYSATQVQSMSQSMPMSLGEGGSQVLYKGNWYENPLGGNMQLWNAMTPQQKNQMVSGIQGAGAGTWREQDYMAGGGTPVPGFDQLGANTGGAVTPPGYGVNPPGGAVPGVNPGNPGNTPAGGANDPNVGLGDTSYGNFAAQSMFDPSFQFRLNQGLGAIESSAAAKGTLHSGGTLKDLNNYAQGMASTEFGNAFDRAVRQGQFDYGVDSADRAFDYTAATGDRQFNADLARFLTEIGYRGTDASTRNDIDISRLIAGLLESQGRATGTGTIGQSNAVNDFLSMFLRGLG